MLLLRKTGIRVADDVCALRPVRGIRMTEGSANPITDEGGLRTMFSPPWACMAKCGACCYLAPLERDLRSDAGCSRMIVMGK